jgi:penicillin-binding protein 2
MYENRRSLETRLLVLRAAVALCFGALAVGFWVLQVVNHEQYLVMSENNHLRTIPLPAPRGVLLDRNGRVLVDNRSSFTIAVIRESSTNLPAALRTLAAATGVDLARITDAMQRHRGDPLYRPIPVIEHATFAQVAAVTARQLELPEVVVQQVPTRAYPDDELAAHLFGYVSEIQEAQLKRPEYAGLQPGAIVGQAGLEKVYNTELMGQDGKKEVVVDSVGREMGDCSAGGDVNVAACAGLGQDNPVGGDRLQLTIDYDLQRALDAAFQADGYAGAAVFLDPHTGEVLAMTSRPAFDPNDFAVGIDRATWAKLTGNAENPLEDRLIQGTYSPGSTFKVVVAIAALSEGVITPDTRIFCPGYATFYGHTFKCSREGGHGWMDLRHAIEQSCNVYFYTVGNMLGVDRIHEYAKRLGLVGKTGIDLPGEVDSLVPSTAWKLKTTGERWYPGETISVAIGQGAVSVTPIALATMIAAVANGGTVVTPHLVKAVDDGDGWQPVPEPAPRSVFPLPPAVVDPVRDGLWMVVNEDGGTAPRARIAGRDVVGKTGTAQVISNQGRAEAAGHTTEDLRDNGWFVFYAPKDNPTIAGVVFAEHGVHGGSAAAPIAKFVLETYFAKHDGQPLPALPTATKAVTTSSPAAAPARSGAARSGAGGW